MKLKTIALYLVPTIIMQYISAYYFSIKFILQPLVNIIVINLAHTIISKLSSDQAQVEEEDEYTKLIKYYLYLIVKLIFFNIFLEYATSGFATYKLLENFKNASDLGNTTYNSYNSRCSAAYYFESKCDQLKARESWDNYKTIWTIVDAGIVDLDIKDGKATGQIIICAPNHYDKVNQVINNFNWRGSQPVQIDEEC